MTRQNKFYCKKAWGDFYDTLTVISKIATIVISYI